MAAGAGRRTGNRRVHQSGAAFRDGKKQFMSEITDQAALLRQVRLAMQNENYPEAIQALKQAATLAHDSGDQAAEGRHLGNLALVYHRTQRPDRALHYFEQALAIARTEADRLTEDGILGNMGNILREVGRHSEALDYLNQALLIAQEIGDVRGRGIWLSNLGLVYDDLGQRKEAAEVHKEAVSVARIMRDQRGLVSRLSNMGNSYLAAADSTEALKCFHEVVSIYKALGDKREAALRMGIIGNIYSDLGRASSSEFEAHFYFDLARDAYIETLALAHELNDKTAEGDLLTSLGNVFGNMGELDQAINHFTAAYQTFQAIGLDDRLPYLQQNVDLAQNLRKQKG
jgi:tetratricopeptide (TPR) repeat protein